MAEKGEELQDVMRVRVALPSREDLPALEKLGPLDWGGRGPRIQEDGRIVGEVYVATEEIEKLKGIKNCEIEVIENATEVGRQRQQEVGKGDRFDGGRKTPHGLGEKE